MTSGYAMQAPAYDRASSGEVPPFALELAFHFYIVYSYLSSEIGLTIPLVGSGLLALMAGCCVLIDKQRPISAYWSQRYVFACATTYLLVQMLVHGNSLFDTYVKEFAPWAMMVLVVAALVRRDGFLLRFAGVAVMIGLAVLPFLKFWGGLGSVARAELDRSVMNGGLSNSNALAEWFGFCCICCVVVAIESKRVSIRAVALFLSVGCLFVVGLTVSRGTLISVALAVTVACRRLLKRGFLPLLALLIAAWVAYASGLFDSVAASYEARGLEDSGRYSVWPLAIARWMQKPFFGVGANNVVTLVPRLDKWVTPHNSFIFMALASGIVPLVFFVLYWFQAFRSMLVMRSARLMDAPFLLPLLAYSLLTAQFGGLTYMAPWMVVTLTAATASGGMARSYARMRTDPRARIEVTGQPAFGGAGRQRAYGYRFNAR